MKKPILVAAAATVLLASAPAGAVSVLYRNDANIGTDYMAQALTALGYAVTATTGNLSAYALSSYDVVVYANQNTSQPDGDAARLSAYIAAGGRVIYDNWLANPVELPTLASTYTFMSNQSAITLSAYTAGIGGTLTLNNPGWNLFSAGLTPLAGGTVAATFANGNAAIVVGNGGRTIHNGFLTDTVGGSQLFQNELRAMLDVVAVPEPASWAMLVTGFAFVGGALRRRRSAPAVLVDA